MKSKFLALFVALPFASLAQQEYTLNGIVPYAKSPAKAYLVYQERGKFVKDSAVVTDGKFTITGKVSAPMKAFVMLTQNGENINSKPSPDQVAVYLENGTIEIDAPESMARSVVTGTQLNFDQMELVTAMNSVKATENQANADFEKAKGDVAKQNEIRAAIDQIQVFKQQLQRKYIETHKNSLVALNLLRANVRPATDLAVAVELFNSLSPELQASTGGQSYARLIGQAKAVNVGAIAPDFTLPSSKDSQISLSSYKGKYVLVDFWASWCGPCRMENPNVVKAFEKYKNKNFTILGVSLDGGDQSREKWLAAIAKDQLPWDQVSDLRGWASEVAKLYQVNAIPANFLIDPTGKIIARDLRGDDLDAKLASILTKVK